MALQSAARSAARELRKGILVRLAIAVVAMIGLALAWQFLQRVEHEPRPESPASTQQKEEEPGPAKTQVGLATRTTVSEGKSDPERGAAKPSEPPQAPLDPQPVAMPQLHSEGMIRTLSEHDPTHVDADVVPPVIAPEAVPISKPKLPNGPYLQVGVFTHPANAAELKAKLEAQGIPVFIATRVQVGPFKDKKEAEAMREKLKAMGMTSILINQ